MPRVLLVAVDDDLAQALSSAALAGVALSAGSESEALDEVCHHAAELDAIVLGPRCGAPIQIAQRAHAADGDLGVLVLADEAHGAELVEAIQFSPLLGDGVRCVPSLPRAALAGELQGVAARTRARRAHRRTIAALNERIAPPGEAPPRTRAEEYFGQIVDHAPIGIVVLDARRRVVGWNREAEVLSGRSEREMLGAALPPLFAANDAFRLEAFLSRAPVTMEPRSSPPLRDTFCMLSAAGPIDVELTRTEITGTSGAAGVLVLMQDVTVRELARREREEARQQAEDASRAKDEFLAVVSHELRTPLTAILGWSRLLAGRTPAPDQLVRGLASIERNAAAQARIVDDILDASRIIMGKLHLDLAPVEVAAMARHAVESAAPTAQAKAVTLRLSAPAPVVVMGDADRLQQALWNLLGNAIKFTPPHGQVDLHVVVREDAVDIVVRDTGAGISADFLPHAFDRFRQADASATRAHGGLGLGLAIVKYIAELHGGSARAESDGLGHGATFAITLPRPAGAPAR